MKIHTSPVLLSALFSTLLLVSVFGTASAAQRPSFSGFFSQSYITTSDNKFFGETNSSGGDWGVLELGGNTRWEIDSRMALAGQVIYRDAGKATDNEYEIDYAFFEYKFISNLNLELGTRIGRTRFEHGFYNAVREIPTARPSILLPQSIYFDRSRNFLRYQDGVELFWKRVTDHYFESASGVLSARINADGDAVETYYLGTPQPGHYETRGAATLMWDRQYTNGWRYRISSGYGAVDYKPSPEEGDVFPAGSSRSFSTTLSAQYDDKHHLRYTGEFLAANAESKNFDPILPKLNTTWYGTYFQATYYQDKYELFGRYGQYWIDSDDRQTLLDLGAQNKTLYGKDWVIGGRYYLRPNLFVAGEAHFIQGVGWLSHVENPDVGTQVENWNMFLMEVGVTF